jgi:hypothetical protein
MLHHIRASCPIRLCHMTFAHFSSLNDIKSTFYVLKNVGVVLLHLRTIMHCRSIIFCKMFDHGSYFYLVKYPYVVTSCTKQVTHILSQNDCLKFQTSPLYNNNFWRIKSYPLVIEISWSWTCYVYIFFYYRYIILNRNNTFCKPKIF